MLLAMLQTAYDTVIQTTLSLENELLLVAQGDTVAFEKVYKAAKSAIYALALSYLKNTHDAEDITQNTFVRVWECAPAYSAKGSPMGWMLTMAKNLCLMKLRSGKRCADLSEDEWAVIPDDANISPDDRILLRDALGILGDEDRRIILLHAVSGLRHKEIAELLRLPLGTVLSRYNRSIKKLTEYTEERKEQ